MDELDIRYRLPLVDIAIPALKQLSLSQYQSFRRNFVALIEMDSRVDLLEWSLQKIVFNHLEAQFFKLPPMKARYSDHGQLKKAIDLELRVLAHAGARTRIGDEDAFSAATAARAPSGLDWRAQTQ